MLFKMKTGSPKVSGSKGNKGNDNRVRKSNTLIHVSYDKKFSKLKVTRKCRSHLAIMGVPGPKGEHFLWPEEAVFLTESTAAVIYRAGRPVTLQDAYRILEDKKVGWANYSTYLTLKKAGYVVVRPRESSVSATKGESDNQIAGPSQIRSPLLDCFPTLTSSQSGSALHLPQLHLSNRLVPLPLESSLQPHSSVLSVTMNSDRKRPCRPRWWPQLTNVAKSSKTWKEWTDAKNEAIAKRPQNKRSASAAECRVDFEVYLPQTYAYNRPVEPSFRVICHDCRTGGPVDLRLLRARTSGVSVVVAMFEQGKVSFVNTNGAPVDIQQVIDKLE